MTYDEVFNNNLAELIKLVSIKSDRYEYALKNSQVSCKIYKTINKKTIEFPVTHLLTNDDPVESLNKYFYHYMKSNLIEHYAVFLPVINSINFKLVMELNNNEEIINLYYKTAFFTDTKNTVVRIRINDELIDNPLNETHVNIEESKHNVVKNLFGLTLDNDFVFDENGITLIEMLSI
jgi:hypothetical protein